MDTTATPLSQKKRDKKKFIDVIEKHQLVDIWRAFHPLEGGYTFHSKVHDTYHRLDYFLTNQMGTAGTASSYYLMKFV